MNFATLQGLTIPEGVVTQIADASGRVLWKLETSKPVVLEVEKITANTTAGETTYENEQFVLMDIYPKTNGTVKVTYGGITKTITDTSGAEEPNAQQVFFGTFNGVSDSSETPANGILTIEGSYRSFATGAYNSIYKDRISGKGCITEVIDFGSVEYIAPYAFNKCGKLTQINIPNEIKSIGMYAFDSSGLSNISLQSGLTSIDVGAFYYCDALSNISLPSGLISIGDKAFYSCATLSSVTLPSGLTSIGAEAFRYCRALSNINLPSGLQVIGEDAFASCELLTKITLPDGLLRLENGAFFGCIALNHVYVPASVTYLGAGSLECYQASNGTITRLCGDYYMKGRVPPEMEWETPENSVAKGAFGNLLANDYNIWVPVGCGETYKTTGNWVKYDGHIQEKEGL